MRGVRICCAVGYWRCCSRQALIIWIAIVGTSPWHVAAQIVMTVDESVESVDDQKSAFMLPSQPAEVSEALEDFLRLSKRGTWSKAFSSLDKIIAAKSTGLVPGRDGLMLPGKKVVQQSIAALPAAGKDAYRLFHDAEAKTKYDQSVGLSEQTRQNLTAVAEDFLFTSSGDLAADQLGDYCFEEGDLDKAAEAWNSLLQFRPESRLPQANTIAKLATAYARNERWEDLERLKRQYLDRFADENIDFGGNKTTLKDYLARLSVDSRRPDNITAEGEDIVLPNETTVAPLWQFRLLKKAEGPRLNVQRGRQIIVNGMLVQANFQVGMPSTVSNNRIILNLLGCHFALDLETGKLLWRNGKFYELMQQFAQGNVWHPDRNRIASDGDTVWSTGRAADQVNNHGAPFHLFAYESATGKEIIGPKTVPELANWNIYGKPLVTREAVFVTATRANQGTELHLLAIAATRGAILWNTLLGNYKTDINQDYQYGGIGSALPEITLHGQKLYVDNHIGALLRVDAKSGGLEWGIAYEAAAPPVNRWGWYNSVPKSSYFGEPIFSDDKLFVKGGKSSKLVVIDPNTPAVLWKRSIDERSRLIAVDSQRAYLTGDELLAIDLNTRKLAWSHRLPQGTTHVSPLVTRSRIYQFTPRGIYEINKADGKLVRLFRGADLESTGGALHLANNTLVAVSNLGVTAYSLQSPSDAPRTAPAQASR